MSREIKFRAWDFKSMRYDVTGLEHGKASEMAGVFLDGDYHAISNEPGDEYNKTASLMQFTGLHDINGVEIYEGDIVKFYDYYSEEVTIHQVKFYGSKGYPAFELEPSISDDTNGFAVVYQAGDGKLIVIGNIHQNPELLEQN